MHNFRRILIGLKQPLFFDGDHCGDATFYLLHQNERDFHRVCASAHIRVWCGAIWRKRVATKLPG